jgi:hypothetical protein
MRHAHLTKGFATDKPVLADKAKQPRQHLVGAGAVVTVKQDDFGDLFAGDLPFTPQAQHVLCVVAFIQVAHACLAGKERLEAFPLQVIQQGDGRDVRVTLAAGFMFSSLKTLGT